MASISVMNSLWTQIQALSLTPSNKKWLAQKLIDSVQEKNREEELLDKISGAWSSDGNSVAEDIAYIYGARQQGKTREDINL